MNNSFAKYFFAAVLCVSPVLCLTIMPAPAQENETGVYDLGEIVVSGKTEGVQATQSVYTVTSEDIQNKDARTLDEAINLLPGVNVRVGPEGTPRIDMRGFRTRHVILLLDGIPINSAFDGQFDPSVIPTENIAKIKITNGPSSVLYGQGGLGGVINIITKKGMNGFRGSVGAETGDHESYLTRASISGGKKGFDFFISGSSTKITSFPLSDDFEATSEQEKGYRDNSDFKRNNLFGNATFNPTKDLNLGFTIAYSEGSFGKPGSVLKEPLDPFAPNVKYERIDHFNNLALQLAGEYDVTPALSVRGWGFLNQGHEHDNLYDNKNFNSTNQKANSFREEIDTRITGVTVQPKYDMGKSGVVTLSLSAEKDQWENDGFVTTAPNTSNRVDVDKSFNITAVRLNIE